MKNLKLVLVVGILLAFLIIAFFISSFLADKAKQRQAAQNNTPINQNQEGQNVPTEPSNGNVALNTYTNTANGFSLQYPNTLKSGWEDFFYSPNRNTQIKTEASFIHEINTEYCGLSGACRPTTQDFGFDIGIMQLSLPQTKAQLIQYGSDPQTETLGSNQVISVSQGAEGEGINYYFVALANNETLVFYQPYIDESVVQKYKTVKDFIPFLQQKAMMRTILSSLTFIK